MIDYPAIKPYIFKIGPLQVRWYGLMYLIGFVSSYLLVLAQVRRKGLNIARETIENLYLALIIGLLVGARLGYVLFYNLPHYIEKPLETVAVWHGGMSFHGGVIGAIVGGTLFCISKKIDTLIVADMVAVTAPIGLGLGRIGNFINGELYGRVTDSPVGMMFPDAGVLPRHPSQLYEFLLEGVLLFIILWLTKDKVKTKGAVLLLFLALYGFFRFIVEFFREPDAQLGLIAGFLTMGQILSASMIAAAAIALLFIKKAGRT